MESAGAATYPDCVNRGIQCSPRFEFSTKCDPSVKHFLPVVLTVTIHQHSNIHVYDLAATESPYIVNRRTKNIYVLEKAFIHTN